MRKYYVTYGGKTWLGLAFNPWVACQKALDRYMDTMPVEHMVPYVYMPDIFSVSEQGFDNEDCEEYPLEEIVKFLSASASCDVDSDE